MVVETLLTVRESLEMKGKGLEWLGFDLMLTEHLQVMLLEVNVSPDVSHRCKKRENETEKNLRATIYSY